jgi:V8-like Glu-specific endopeptidase
MDSGKAREMFEKYAVALAYVAVETPEGDQTVGSAFHVGEGVFVTARHVLENNKILDVASTERTYIPLSGAEALEARIYETYSGGELGVMSAC